jgi:hypothetical protein
MWRVKLWYSTLYEWLGEAAAASEAATFELNSRDNKEKAKG